MVSHPEFMSVLFMQSYSLGTSNLVREYGTCYEGFLT
jgi:hypothetical protein